MSRPQTPPRPDASRNGAGPAQAAAAEQQRVVDELVAFAYPADPRLEADMVMKGGITSGVVYPLAVCQLAKTYRFRNLGGTSAGGIAAAFAAAAELNRAGGGFNELARLPDLLGRELAGLFQPSQGTRPLYAVLLAAVDKTRCGRRRHAATVRAAVRATGRWFAGAAALGLLVGLCGLLVAAGLPRSAGEWGRLAAGLPFVAVLAAVAGLVASAAGLAAVAARELPANGHGLCRGSRGPAWPGTAPTEVEPFTDWMHARLNATAGLTRGDVLTFGHLWGADAVARYAAAGGPPEEAMAAAEPRILLEMMTTNVTQCRPTRLPIAGRHHLYCPVEWAAYFPPPVLDHLRATADPASTPRPCPAHGCTLVPLPDRPDLPVVVAVRMTLSFPGLVSAVPLYVVDFGAPDAPPVRCWFSDGGISSNFPIHFFDSLWPRRPTFGISLGPYHPDHPGTDVYLPEPDASGRQPRVRRTETLGGFAGAILDTLQNWSDEGQSMLPGYWDRIVTIHHREDEGGLNLAMDPPTIRSLAYRGYLAGVRLGSFDFPRHRWTRFLIAASRLDDLVRGLAARYDDPLPDGSPGYRAFVGRPPADPSALGRRRSGRWRREAVARMDRLLAFAGRPDPAPPSPDFRADAPRPAPDLRVTPRF